MDRHSSGSSPGRPRRWLLAPGRPTPAQARLAQAARRHVKVNATFGGAPGGVSHPPKASGSGFGYGPELLDEMTQSNVVHLAAPPI